MSFLDDLKTSASKDVGHNWTTRAGQKVPSSEDIGLGRDAVRLSATVLYADIRSSTELVRSWTDFFAASVFKAYLDCAARVIRYHGGAITSYDGDRVMAVFIGEGKNTAAAKVGLKINWVTKNVVQPEINRKFSDGSNFELKQAVGIDTSDLFVARTGIRGSNDLVWVGRAANYAAKMSELPADTYNTYISADVYGMLLDEAKYSNESPPKHMWTNLGSRHQVGVEVYGSNFWWSV